MNIVGCRPLTAPTRPKLGDLYKNKATGAIYMVTATPTPNAYALTALASGLLWAADSLFNGRGDEFEKLPPGMLVTILVEE